MSRIRATSPYRFHAGGSGGKELRARVPAEVRDKLGAREGDRLVFEEGTTWVAERAAGKGPYFVLTVERGKAPAGGAAPVEESAPAPALESLEEAVRKKKEGDRR